MLLDDLNTPPHHHHHHAATQRCGRALLTSAHPLQGILPEEQGDELLSVRRGRVFAVRPVDLVWKTEDSSMSVENV